MSGKEQGDKGCVMPLLHRFADSEKSGRNGDEIPEGREDPGEPDGLARGVVRTPRGPVGSPEPWRVGMSGLQCFLRGELLLPDERGGDAAESYATEGEREDRVEPSVRPVVHQRRAHDLGRREHAEGRERQKKEHEAADGIHRAGPVATGVSSRPPHSVHDPS